MGLFMGMREETAEEQRIRTDLASIKTEIIVRLIRDSRHWEDILGAAKDVLIDDGDVVSRDEYEDVKGELTESRRNLAHLESATHADAARLQSLIAEGDRAGALALLREMFDGADLLSDAAAMMCAGFRQEALL